MSKGAPVSMLSVQLNHTGLEPGFGTPLESSDARAASSASEPGSTDFVSEGRRSAANASPTNWADLRKCSAPALRSIFDGRRYWTIVAVVSAYGPPPEDAAQLIGLQIALKALKNPMDPASL